MSWALQPRTLPENVVINTISMLQPGATDADTRQAICNCYVEYGVTKRTTMNISSLADIQRCQEVIQHNFMHFWQNKLLFPVNELALFL
jgi:hypothetical protein